jgi:thiamine biosynthesis lipoprotein
MRRRTFLRATLAAAIPLATWPRRSGSRVNLVERWSWAMGQPVHLLLFHESEAAGLEAAQAAFAELRRVESRLSRFDDASDLSELNRRAGRGPMRGDTDLLAVLRASVRHRAASRGAFDVAVEPLMRVWGFRDPRKRVPGATEIREARQAVRAAVIRVDADRIELPAAHTRLDLGGIGVGYGLDRAGEVLRGRGVSSALLDVSGDILAIGAPPGREGWPVDIANPQVPGRRVASTLLRDQALATSANTVSVVRLGQMLCGHVMDPELGCPADRLLQATVTARTGLEADVLSTAMLVAGRAFPGVEWSWMVGKQRADSHQPSALSHER